MDKEMKIITEKSEIFGEVRFAIINGKEYAVARDIAIALGYKNPNDAISKKCKGVAKYDTPTNGGIQKLSYILEADIYRLIFGSKLPEAEKFQDWVFDIVLPQLRQTGGYIPTDAGMTEEELMAKAYVIAQNTIKRCEEQRKQMQQELEHKDEVIVGLVDQISLAEKRQILNRVVRYKNNNYKERWAELYKQFEMKYHISSLKQKVIKYNETHKPKMKSVVDYIDKVMNKIPELYEIACKLYESDIKELQKELYDIV